MTTAQIEAFQKDIANVCNKHKIGAMGGIWFAGKGHDEYGFLKTWDVTDTEMKRLSNALMEIYIKWADEISKGVDIGTTQTTSDQNGGAN